MTDHHTHNLTSTFAAWINDLNALTQRRWGTELLDLPSDHPYSTWYDQGLSVRQAFLAIASS